MFLCMCQVAKSQNTGILLVHYGTQNDKSRRATLDRLNEEVAHTFHHCKVMEAYAASSVIAMLDKRGIHKNSIAAALDSLHAQGCDTLIVQSTMLLDGIMMDLLQEQVKKVKSFFKRVSVARPLLYSVQDCRRLINLISSHLSSQKLYRTDEAQIVLVGHGSDSPANAMYSQIDYLAKDEGYSNWHVGTIEGYPTLESVQRQLAKNKQKHVVLVPLLYIAGNHQREDIAGVWKQAFVKNGYQVTVVDEGLGEMSEMRKMILDNIKKIIEENE